jgi:hypothetical protein
VHGQSVAAMVEVAWMVNRRPPDHLPARVDAARYHVAGREIVDIQNGEEGRHAVAVDEAFVAAKCWKRWRWGRRW